MKRIWLSRPPQPHSVVEEQAGRIANGSILGPESCAELAIVAYHATISVGAKVALP